MPRQVEVRKKKNKKKKWRSMWQRITFPEVSNVGHHYHHRHQKKKNQVMVNKREFIRAFLGSVGGQLEGGGGVLLLVSSAHDIPLVCLSLAYPHHNHRHHQHHQALILGILKGCAEGVSWWFVLLNYYNQTGCPNTHTLTDGRDTISRHGYLQAGISSCSLTSSFLP